MSTSDSKANRLPEQLPVYLTPQVAARKIGVHDHTITKYVEADAWRMDRDGSLHPMYAQATIETFKATYRDGRFKAAGGAR